MIFASDPAAQSARTDFFRAKLEAETDSSDVHEAMADGEPGFILVDVRNRSAWAQGRAAGAIHLPYRQIVDRAAEEIPAGMPVVVYCWSPGCNAGAKAALIFAELGYPVKEMIGGFEYWAREGYPVVDDLGPVTLVVDPLTAVTRAGLRGSRVAE